MKNIEKSTEILQDNLCELRKIAGFTMVDLGEKLGVTKQTISNLESQKVKMSKIQYIAIRSIFECEAYIQKNNLSLRKILNFILNIEADCYEKEKSNIRTILISIASTASAGVKDLELYSLTISLLSPIGNKIGINTVGGNSIPTLEWLLEIME